MLEREYSASHPSLDLDGKGASNLEERSNTFGITQIAIERTACYGHCPVYVAVINQDGQASYFGGPDAPRRGLHSGTVYPSGFAYLARLANELRIRELSDGYSVPVTDSPTVYVSVTQHGKKKLIQHYAPYMSGQARLIAFENEIDRVLERAHD